MQTSCCILHEPQLDSWDMKATWSSHRWPSTILGGSLSLPFPVTLLLASFSQLQECSFIVWQSRGLIFPGDCWSRRGPHSWQTPAGDVSELQHASDIEVSMISHEATQSLSLLSLIFRIWLILCASATQSAIRPLSGGRDALLSRTDIPPSTSSSSSSSSSSSPLTKFCGW